MTFYISGAVVRVGVKWIHHRSQHRPLQGRKDSEQGAQEPEHLPKVVGQAVQCSVQTNQLHFQPTCAERIIHESHQPAASVPFPDERKMKLPSQEDKTAVVARTVTDDVRILEVPKLKAWVLSVSSCARNHILQAGGKILTSN